MIQLHLLYFKTQEFITIKREVVALKKQLLFEVSHKWVKLACICLFFTGYPHVIQ